MQKTVIVAGAGVGGFVTGGLLAKKGFSVTLIHKGATERLGYDWTDSLDVSLLEKIIGKPIPAEEFCYDDIVAFFTPDGKTKVSNADGGARTTTKMERRVFEKYIADFAQASGVRIIENVTVQAPLCEGNKIVGIQTDSGDFYADLVVDACGIDSPLRNNLPIETLIERSYSYGEAFFAYRAMYERNILADKPDCPLEIYLLHRGEAGMAWYCTRDDEIDVLIGRFSAVAPSTVKDTLKAFASNHPELVKKVKRGGDTPYKIPVRRPLNKFVADGYAAIGDSAYMTLPMNGSGINFTMKAALILCDTVAEADGDYSTEKLWSYQYKYYSLYGKTLAGVEAVKNALLGMKPSRVDFLFANKIITQKEMDSEEELKLSAKELLGKALRGMKNPPALFALVKGLAASGALTKHFAALPKEYSASAFRKWNSKADSLLLPIKE